jgi:copper(I)-binding protein
MRKLLALALAAVLAGALLGACGEETTDDQAATELSVTDVRSRMSPMVAGAAAVYLTIENPTDTDDALVAASVAGDVAASVELHETVEGGGMDGMGEEPMEEGMGDDAMGDDAPDEGMGDDAPDEGMGDAPMMSMREVGEIAVPSGSTVELAPGGLHIMLLDLEEDLAVGDTFELTLQFQEAGDLTVTVEVREQV